MLAWQLVSQLAHAANRKTGESLGSMSRNRDNYAILSVKQHLSSVKGHDLLTESGI